MAKDAMVFPFRWFDTLRQLPDAERLQMLDAIRDYAMSAKAPKFTGIMAALWNEFQQRIDHDRDIYNAKCERNRENGKLGAEFGKMGGRPKKDKTPNAAKKPQKTADGVLETPKTPDAEAEADAEAEYNGHLPFDANASSGKSRAAEKSDSAGGAPKKAKKGDSEITFDYDGDRKIHGITPEQLEQWRGYYDGIDLEMELGKASAWLDANRRKINIKAFLVNWLNKAQDRSKGTALPRYGNRAGVDYAEVERKAAALRAQQGDDPRYDEVSE